MELSLLILVCIHKSCIVYLEIYNIVPIGHGFSFFWSWKSHGKSTLKRRGHPACYFGLGLKNLILFTSLTTVDDIAEWLLYDSSAVFVSADANVWCCAVRFLHQFSATTHRYCTEITFIRWSVQLFDNVLVQRMSTVAMTILFLTLCNPL